MSFIKRKKHAALFRPDAWHAQKGAQAQSVVAAEPAPVVVAAPKKRAKKKAKR